VNRSALRDTLERQAEWLASIRAFFAARSVVEVTTPSLAPTTATDPAIASIACHVRSLNGPRFLQTSPEHAMKRLLAAGSGDIWQLARVYRDGELGRWHQPEFLLLEWYRVGFDEFRLMNEVFDLLAELYAALGTALGRIELTYAEAFRAQLDVDPHAVGEAETRRLADAVRAAGVEVPASLQRTALLDLALSTVIVPAWPRDMAVFLYDYPVAQAALAAIKPGPPAVAARFEVFVNGLELGNGYRELTDADEQRRRFEADLAVRRTEGLDDLPIDEALLAAMRAGLPECAGVALGVERLLALLSGARDLSGVIALAHERH
jgi:lysyl-tRNA synthetase class 2